MAEMSEEQRLELIAEAVRYCQRVKRMGMPSSCYSKALREPVYFLWELREGRTKASGCRYRSQAAVGLTFGDGRLISDHAIPFCYLERELLALDDVTPEVVRSVLLRYEVRVLITKSENERLSASGLQSKMPLNWDGADPLARYRAVGIELMENNPSAKKAYTRTRQG